MPRQLKAVRENDLICRLAEILIASGLTVDDSLDKFHRALLEAALDVFGGNQVQTARHHNLHRNTLRTRMIHLGLLEGPPDVVAQLAARLAPHKTGESQARELPQA